MVPPDSIGISRAPTYSGTLTLIYWRFAYGTFTLCGPPFQARSATRSTRLLRAPQPRRLPAGLGSSPFARRYLGNLVFDFFSSRYLDVSVPWVGSFRCLDMTPGGFPHSEIPGSKLACSSPRLIAACHVLHRRHVPRHPPCALYYLTRKICGLAYRGANPPASPFRSHQKAVTAIRCGTTEPDKK